MTTLILVPGTFGGHAAWTAYGTPFRRFVEARGFTCIVFQGWSGDVDGLALNPIENGKHADWIAGGYGLSYLLRSYPDAAVLAHSHGGQVVAYCCARTKTPVRAYVDVCAPVRGDMYEAYLSAKPFIGHHRHVYASGWDLWQRAGELFDGHIGWTRQMPDTDDNQPLAGISHSKLLTDPAYLPLLETAGILDVLHGSSVLQEHA